MLTNNYVNRIFEKSKTASKSFDRSVFKFMILAGIEKALVIIFNFFTKDEDSEFLTTENGKYIIFYRDEKNIVQICLEILKVDEKKYVGTITLTNGEIVAFQKLMKIFFENNKSYFNLF